MECLSAAAATIVVVQVISSTYGKLQHIEALPEAFLTVRESLPIAEESLILLQKALNSGSIDWHHPDEDVQALSDGLKECLELLRFMDIIVRDVRVADIVGSGLDSRSVITDQYRRIVVSFGMAYRIETLMLNLLVELTILLLNDRIAAHVELSKEDEDEMKHAYRLLTEVAPSLPAVDFAMPSTTNTIQDASKSGEIVSKFQSHEVPSRHTAKFHHHKGLLWAARNGNTEVVRALVRKESMDPNHKDANGRTPLSWAAERGHCFVTRLLLEFGGDVESRDNSGRTPLSWAAGEGHCTVVRLLLYQGCDTDSRDHSGRTPLSWALAEGHFAASRFLLDEGSDARVKDNAGRTPLSWAMGKRHEMIHQLLSDISSDLTPEGDDGQTPLSGTAREWYGKEANKLLPQYVGASTDSVSNSSGTLPLRTSGKMSNWILSQLNQAGADVDSADGTGRTLLSWAAEQGQEVAVINLLGFGADANSKDEKSRTPLFWAADNGQEAVVTRLLDAGANANSEDDTGCTPLLQATKRGHLGIALRLLSMKDIDISSLLVEEAGWLSQYKNGNLPEADVRPLHGELNTKLHQPFCAHKLRQSDEQELNKTRDLDLRAQHICQVDMRTQLSLLCGLAGVFPPGSRPSSGLGWASFLHQRACIFFTDDLQRLATRPDRVEELTLQLHQTASGLVFGANYLQQSGFCCNQFTVLTAYQYGSDQPTVRMNTISFELLSTLLETITALRTEGLSEPAISRCVLTSMQIMERLFDVTLAIPATDQLKLHYCALSVQLLSLALVLYSQAHAGDLHAVYLAEPLSEVILCGSLPYQLQIAAEQHKLSCMGEMVGNTVFAFRLISQTVPVRDRKGPAHLSATCEEIVDSWGPGSLLFSDPKEPSEDMILGLAIRGGIIQCPARLSQGDGPFHWGEQLFNTDLTSSKVFSYREKLVIGAVLDAVSESSVSSVRHKTPGAPENAAQNDHPVSRESAQSAVHELQHQHPGVYRSVKVNGACKRDSLETWKASQGHRTMLGTQPSAWKFVERSFVLQFGDKVLGQIGGTQTKQPGVPAKQAVLDRWTNEGNLLLLEELYGLQVSLCTGVARRVPLRVLICHDLIAYIRGLRITGWEQMEEQVKTAMSSKEAFWDWDMKLGPESESRKCMVNIVDKLLRRLKDTGFDKNGDYFALLWPNKSEAHHCVKMTPDGDQAWCRMLKDKEWSTTFAVATDLCLEAPSYKCRAKQVAWGGMKIFSTFMFYSEPGGNSTKCARSWQINNEKWYWNGEAGGKVLFLARKEPTKVTELDFHRSRMHLVPKRLWSLMPAVEVLVEITSMEDSGEEVLIACRS